MIGHLLLLEWFVTESVKHQRIKKKFFSLTSGNTKNSHRNFIDRLMKQGSQIEEVDTPQRSDFIVFFCPVVSRAGTDIEAALRKLNDVADTKLAIVVVLHYTFDPECIVPESYRVVNRENTLTVDCLFHEDQGLLRCQKNADSLNHVVNRIKSWFKPEDLFDEQSEDTTRFTRSSENTKRRNIGNNYLLLLADITMTSHKTFMDRLTEQIPNIQPVNPAEEFNFILVFCPVVSRAGTDIEAALHKLNDISGTASAILVVLHYTFDPECIVPESNRVVNRKNTLTVDCLFHEDQGLLRCPKNEDSLNHVVNKIKSWLKPEDLFNEQSTSIDEDSTAPSGLSFLLTYSQTIKEQSADENKDKDSPISPDEKQSADKNTESSAKLQENQQYADKNEEKDISRPAGSEKVEKTDENNNKDSFHQSPEPPQTQNAENNEDETWEYIAEKWYWRSFWVF